MSPSRSARANCSPGSRRCGDGGEAAVRRLLPRSLIGQMALLIGAALFVAQLVNFTLTLSERQKLSLAQNEGPAITRFVSTAVDVANAEPDFRQPLVADASR